MDSLCLSDNFISKYKSFDFSNLIYTNKALIYQLKMELLFYKWIVLSTLLKIIDLLLDEHSFSICLGLGNYTFLGYGLPLPIKFE